MLHRYAVYHANKMLASVHAPNEREACRLACRMISRAPDPRDCTAVPISFRDRGEPVEEGRKGR